MGERFFYRCQNIFDIFKDLLLAEAQNSESKLGKCCLAIAIIFVLSLVNLSIHFDHQPGGLAVKIDDITSNDLLTAEMPAIQAVCAQACPKRFFCFGHAASVFYGCLFQCRRNLLSGQWIMNWHKIFFISITPDR